MADWRTLPPLSALRAFCAFAEAGALEPAGARIGVTHAAVSQQIRGLEARLGLTLVERRGKRLALTAQGQQLAAALSEGFGLIGRTIAEMTGREATRPLRITTTDAFAGGWLLGRLQDFRTRHPGIDLVLDPTPDLRDLGTQADVAIRFGKGRWPGAEARLLLRTPIVLVAAPRLVPEGAATDMAALARLPWLQEIGTSEATAYMESHGVVPQGPGFLSLPGSLLLDAVRDGQGLTVIARAFVEADLAAGRLRLIHEDSEREGYFLVTRTGSLRPAVAAFCKWALRQAGQI
ncbi:MAG: LysR family transcriptional regulator [Proteobacteria bacterium]|nr:LysR family transcriptional regulator [Pseudomonadota bacterium]MBS0574755.1 LysR family transcriptional regulator [Pseudomonadota bacterium]